MNLLQIFVLILPFVLVSGYDDLRSRQLFSMSAAGLAADPTICMKKTFPDTNWSLIKTETAFDVLYKMNITVFAIINHDEKKIIISFAVDEPDVFAIINHDEKQIIISFAVDEPDDEKNIEQMFKTSKPVEFHNFGNVQSIFFELEEQIWDGVHAIVAAENYLEYSTTFTGYSFGGAIATLAAMRTIARGFRTSEKIELYTFGEPRVGTLVFANSVDREIPQKFRITHSGDPIVHIPKCIQKDEKKIEQMFKTSKPVEFHNFGNVQSIFFELEEQVWDGVHAIVAAENYLEYSTTFTGYSFGGAIATLAAMRTIARGFRTSEKIELYTFGEPRVGTLVFANSVDREIPQKFRITHSGDPIVHMPKCIQKGEFSCSINEPNGPIHHGTEIFYDNDMKFGANYLKCTLKDEDENCANKKINQLDFKNHQYYFQFQK
uniref:Fungal lipase-like domain-containing protein n=1 Tax=Panagrolaimus sp. JU765 TaxID=591449 RepID=A0AC34QJ21_9BILA